MKRKFEVICIRPPREYDDAFYDVLVEILKICDEGGDENGKAEEVV